MNDQEEQSGRPGTVVGHPKAEMMAAISEITRPLLGKQSLEVASVSTKVRLD